MLTEIAFTPDVFSEEKHDPKNWPDQLRQIRDALSPQLSESSVVVSNIYNGSWWHEIRHSLSTVQNDTTKNLLQSILCVMYDRLVVRPGCNDVFPTTDIEWGQETLATHAIEEVDRIVATRETQEAIKDNTVREISELTGRGFWSDISANLEVDPYFEDQMPLIRKFCRHAKWLALIDPYANGGELIFTTEVLKTLMFDTPDNFSPDEIEIHFAKSRSGLPPREQQEKLKKQLEHEIQNPPVQRPTINLFCWEDLRERSLIAGDFTEDGDGVNRRRARWGLGMSHVAIQPRPVNPNDRQDKNRWNLLSKKGIDHEFRRKLETKNNPRPEPTPVFP